MAKKRRSSQFKDTSQVIDIEEARKKRQEKREKQRRRSSKSQNAEKNQSVRARVKAGRRKKRMLYAVIILAIIAAVGMSVYNVVSLKVDQREIKKEQQELLHQKEQLEQQIEESDQPKFIEDTARQVLKMVNPGETIYIIDNDGGEETPAETKESE